MNGASSSSLSSHYSSVRRTDVRRTDGCARGRLGRSGLLPVGLLPVGLLVMLAGMGCGRRPAEIRQTPGDAAGDTAGARAAGSDGRSARPGHGMNDQTRRQLLAGAVGVLGRLDDFEESAAVAQVFDRLNQWRHAIGNMEPAGLQGSLWREVPGPLRRAAGAVIEPTGFDAVDDVHFLRDQRWLADIAGHVVGEGLDDLAAAKRLFRWTVESLALVADPPSVPSDEAPGRRWYLPGEILLLGRASAPQRAWVFLELLRHAGLDGVMLGTRSAPGQPARPWVPALVSGGECHLFEPTYGMPIPGPGWQGIATARQAAEDPQILGQLDLPERPYPVRSEDVRDLVVLVAASAQSFSARMRRLEADLTGAAGMRIGLDADGLAERAIACLPAADGAEDELSIGGRGSIWSFPLETVRRRREFSSTVAPALAEDLAPFSVALVGEDLRGAAGGARRPLYAARVREFRNQLDGPDGAKAAYLLARPSKSRIREIVSMVDPSQADAVGRICLRMKEDATYWLGLLLAREGQFEAAVDYLDRMTLAASADSPWADAARVAAARGYAGLGRVERARELLMADESPQRFGSRLVADRLGDSPAPESAP
jgi:tetratricopeptide (TPR) repeat protein